MQKIKLILILLVVILVFIMYNTCSEVKYGERVGFNKIVVKPDPPCLQMFYYIKKYAKQYEIPLDYAFGLAYQETGYRGPLHYSYKHNQTSSVNAEGPMQIMVPTAEWINGNKINRKELRENIELNVRISMKLLRYLKNKYGDWRLVMGCYNTGKPCVNQYALNIVNKNYKWD